MVNIERLYYEKLQQAVGVTKKSSASTYFRDLLVADLMRLGLLSADDMLEVTLGSNDPSVQVLPNRS